MKRVIPFIVFLTIIGSVVGYWYYAPLETFNKIQTGLKEGDRFLLEEAIDFERLRANLKTQLKSQMMRKLMEDEGGEQNQFAVLGAAFGVKLADTLVDSFVTPEALISIYKENGEEGIDDTNITIRNRGIDRVIATVTDKDGEKVDIVLERYGVGYRVVNVLLPEDASEKLQSEMEEVPE
ncbi:MAG: DUF2939 domain-containing protein [Epsilonproteobacteria bacterium]|nr:DUF2939 domain-containing protein [Campylobacterota bacterium]